MKQLVKVHMLPTEDDSVLYANQKNIPGNYSKYAGIRVGQTQSNQPPRFQNQHLYITSDERIEEGNYVLSTKYNEGYNIQVVPQYSVKSYNDSTHYRKIVATTDKSLGLGDEFGGWYPLPQIPQQFIEEYCKAGGIDEVLVEYKENNNPNLWGQDIGLATLVLKLDQNNCVITHLVESKLYTSEEVLLFGEYLMKLNNNIIKKKTKLKPLDGITGPKLVKDLLDNWIKENLK